MSCAILVRRKERGNERYKDGRRDRREADETE
jgi:hypothetical protein